MRRGFTERNRVELLALIRIKRAYLVGLVASVRQLHVQVPRAHISFFLFSSLKVFLCKERWFRWSSIMHR
jgi:hypothetical protein